MRVAHRKRREAESGITLIELLVSMIILGIVSTMLIAGWINLQRASAFALRSNNARAEARDGLSRMTIELRDAQPPVMPTASPSPTAWAVYTVAQPMQVVFYSSFNQPGAGSDGTGTGALKLTRMYLDTSGPTPQKTLYWQRDTDGVAGWTSGDRQFILAKNVVNSSTPSTSAPTAIFTYGYRQGGVVLWTDNSDSSLDLTTIVAVKIRLITDMNSARSPAYIDLSTTVRPRNASGG
jgi:prepilin-type N-terminal cleavage/methylation domain-containing protein